MERQDLTVLLEGCIDLIRHREHLLRHPSRILEEQILLFEQRKGFLLRLQPYAEAVKRFLDGGPDASPGYVSSSRRGKRDNQVNQQWGLTTNMGQMAR